jgi:hypothetical protein
MMSVPAFACAVLPDTGASIISIPCARASVIRRELAGAMVLSSIQVAPERAPARTPSGP